MRLCGFQDLGFQLQTLKPGTTVLRALAANLGVITYYFGGFGVTAELLTPKP